MSGARNKCKGFGGDLAIIKSAGENAFIFDLVKVHNAGAGVWLGLERKAADHKFYWLDGTPLAGNYNAWASGEPNDGGGIEDCAHMYGSGGNGGKWNDSPCDWGATPRVLCQKPK